MNCLKAPGCNIDALVAQADHYDTLDKVTKNCFFEAFIFLKESIGVQDSNGF
jgi:hypothetical protein